MRFWKEPLVQFLFVGGLLFAAYTALAPETESLRERIVVNASRIQSLEQSFEAAWKRPPTSSERQGLIDDFLIEEVFYREALKLRLDQDDVVIRRRMRQKVEFLLQDGVARTQPPEDELRAFFERDPTPFRKPVRITFRQVYLGQGVAAAEKTDLLLVKLNAKETPDTHGLGQRTMLPERVASAAISEIDGLFGSGFGQSLMSVPTGRWVGPVQSGFGTHLVYVDEILPAPPVTFENARAAIIRDYRYDQQRKATDTLVERLMKNYEIVQDDQIQ